MTLINKEGNCIKEVANKIKIERLKELGYKEYTAPTAPKGEEPANEKPARATKKDKG